MQKMEQLTTRYIQQNSLYRFDHNRSQKQEIILKQEKNILQAKVNNSVRMNTLYYSFIMSFLKENYPEILKSIDRIYEPDLSKISQVIDCYCEFVNIPSQQIMGEYINYKDIQHRYKAIAVVLRIFQPEKLDNLKTKVKSSIYKELGPYLKINSDTLQKSIICACNQFDLYREFKKEIKQVANYYLINARLNNA
jgi:hypothetical protein